MQIARFFGSINEISKKILTMAQNKVLVYGSVAYDSIETPFDKEEYILGGSASYAALAASFFAPASIVGVVGEDFKESDIKRLLARGVNLDGLQIKKGEKTFFWRGKYYLNFNKRDTLEVALNVSEHCLVEVPQSQRDAQFVLLGNNDPMSQTKVLDSVTSPKFTVLDTMNLWIETALKQVKELIKRVDLLILNDSEAQQLANENNVIVCGDILRDMGAKTVIIKKGEHGAMLFHKDGFFTICAYPVRSLHDPTGAGDSFAGALTGYLAKCDSVDFNTLKEAMIVGSAVASITVESFSCYKLERAGLAEIEARVKYIKEISQL